MSDQERRTSAPDEERPRLSGGRHEARTLADLLIELASKLRRDLHLPEALRIIASTAAVATDSAQVAVRLLDESGDRLLVGARVGPMMQGKQTARFEKHEGFQGWVLAEGRADLCNDPQSDPRFALRSSMAWVPTAMGGVPLVDRQGVIGVLIMSRRCSRPYEVTDLRILEAIAGSVGPYLEMQRLAQLAVTDTLTLLPNRRAYDEQLPRMSDRARHRARPLSLVMIDLDHFGDINNTRGYDVGDAVLVETAHRIRAACRAEDLVFRWGGDEMVLLLPDTDKAEAIRVGGRVLAGIRSTPYRTTQGDLPLTASLGVAELEQGASLDEVKRRAGDAVHQAKHDGRNCVRAWCAEGGAV